MRLFVAVPLPEELKAKVSELLHDLADACPAPAADIQWTPPEQVHFTLKFLGNASEDQLLGITQALEGVARGIQPFRISVGGIGRFPPQGIPRVLWLGVQEGQEALQNLAARVESALNPLGFPREDRPYTPHATLGRLKRLRNMAILQTPLEKYKAYAAGAMDVNSFALMSSRLSSSGAVHTPLQSFLMQKSPIS